jgi:TP901 family phage tail tape measure protein
MAVATMRVPTIFTAVDRFSSVVSRMTGGVNAFGRTAEAAAMRTSRQFNSAGNAMLGAGVGLATGLGYAVNEAVKFEKAMATVSTTIDSTPESMKSMSNEVLAMARTIPKPISELTTALYDVVSAGIESQHAMTVLNASGRLAVAGLGTTQEGVDVLTSSLNSFNISAAESESVANMVFKAVKYGKTTVSQLAESFGSSSALIKNSNVSLAEYLATTAVLTTTGMTASRAQTQVASAVTALIKPSKSMAAVLDSLGAKNIPKFIKQSGGLVKTLKLVSDRADEMGILTSKAFGRKEGFSAMLSLLGPLKDKYAEVMSDMVGKTDTLTEAFNKQKVTVAANAQIMKNKLTTLAITIGEELLPRVNGFIDKISSMTDSALKFAKRNEGLVTTLLNVTVGLLALGAAAKIGAALFFGLSKVIGVVTALTEAYTFVSTLAALSNVGLGTATMSATGAMWKFVTAQLAALAPLAIAAGALGVLALAYKVVSDATRKTMYTTIDSYKKSDATIKYSTVVMQSEFDKQFGLMKAQRDRIDAFNGKAVNVGNIGLQKGGFYNLGTPYAMGLKDSKTPFSDEASRRGMTNQFNGLSNFTSLIPDNSVETPMAQPKNLAGKSETKYSLPKVGGTLKVNLTAPPGYGVDIDESQVEGISVNTSSTKKTSNPFN